MSCYAECPTDCYHDKPVLGHCAFINCPNYRGNCPEHRRRESKMEDMTAKKKTEEDPALDQAATDGWDVDHARIAKLFGEETYEDTLRPSEPDAKAAAHRARSQATTALRVAELARASAHHNGRNMEEHNRRVEEASAAYERASKDYEPFERDIPDTLQGI